MRVRWAVLLWAVLTLLPRTSRAVLSHMLHVSTEAAREKPSPWAPINLKPRTAASGHCATVSSQAALPASSGTATAPTKAVHSGTAAAYLWHRSFVRTSCSLPTREAPTLAGRALMKSATEPEADTQLRPALMPTSDTNTNATPGQLALLQSHPSLSHVGLREADEPQGEFVSNKDCIRSLPSVALHTSQGTQHSEAKCTVSRINSVLSSIHSLFCVLAGGAQSSRGCQPASPPTPSASRALHKVTSVGHKAAAPEPARQAAPSVAGRAINGSVNAGMCTRPHHSLAHL